MEIRPETIGVDAMLTIPDLESGDHLVLLTGLGTDCGVTGSNPLSLQLAPNATARAEFAVACFASRGSVRVETVTSGPAPDLDGYTVALDDGPARPIASGGAAEFADVPNGTHRVRLSGLAAYCFPMESNPQVVEVRGEEATRALPSPAPAPPPGERSCTPRPRERKPTCLS